MCGPAALLFAVGAAGAVADFAASSQQAAYQETNYLANKANAEAALRNDYSQLNLRQIQEGEKKSAENVQTAIKAAQAAARSRAAAGEAGVTGISVENLVADIGKQASDEQTARNYNFVSTVTQLQKEKTGAQATAQSRILSVPRGIQPSPLSLAVGIGKAFAGSYGGKV